MDLNKINRIRRNRKTHFNEFHFQNKWKKIESRLIKMPKWMRDMVIDYILKGDSHGMQTQNDDVNKKHNDKTGGVVETHM